MVIKKISYTCIMIGRAKNPTNHADKRSLLSVPRCWTLSLCFVQEHADRFNTFVTDILDRYMPTFTIRRKINKPENWIKQNKKLFFTMKSLRFTTAIQLWKIIALPCSFIVSFWTSIAPILKAMKRYSISRKTWLPSRERILRSSYHKP